jgi:hypothetical protein
MNIRRVSIARVMTIIAILAANLAFLRELPWEVRSFPTVWVALWTADFVLLWKVVHGQPFRAGQYTLLIVFLVSYVVLAYQSAMERIHPIAPFIRGYQQITGDHGRNVLPLAIAYLGNIWMAGVLAILIAWPFAIGAAWLERRRRLDLAAWYLGALLGFGVGFLLGIGTNLLHVLPSERALTFANNIALTICVIVGGGLGLAYLRSERPPARKAMPKRY